MPSPFQRDVRGFMLASGQSCPEVPTEPSETDRILRAKLIFEEALETIEALGIGVALVDYDADEHPEYSPITGGEFDFQANGFYDPVEFTGGCIDLVYVTLGGLVTAGVDDTPCWQTVQESNMAKVDAVTGAVIRDDSGKVRKPANWTPPDIATAIEAGDVTQPSTESKLRRMFAYAVAGASLYTDDGELQDGRDAPPIDFKRDSVEQIQAAFQRRNERKIREAVGSGELDPEWLPAEASTFSLTQQ